MIGADVVSRNLGGGGVSVSNELSEDILYLMTLLVAPWLLRQGQHIRVDIILRALPIRVAWLLEWLGDIVGFVCCLYFLWYGYLITAASYSAGSINIKTLVTPEWWTLAPLPFGFALLAIEFIFRMVSNGNVTGIIDRLAAEKLVLRQAPASDRRSYIVRLTPKGASQFSTIAKAHEIWIDELLVEIDALEAETLIERLDELVRRVRNGEARP